MYADSSTPLRDHSANQKTLIPCDLASTAICSPSFVLYRYLCEELVFCPWSTTVWYFPLPIASLKAGLAAASSKKAQLNAFGAGSAPSAVPTIVKSP